MKHSATQHARRLFVGILWLTVAASQASEIYKSVDANGNVVYSDHLDPSISQSVVRLEEPGLPPHELHFCWTNCFTLILDNGAYRRADGTDESWTVETFSRKAVVLHRHDAPAEWNGYSPDVLYAGQVANDRLVGVTVNGKPTSGIDASWGIALNTLPGNNAERDAKSDANTQSPSSVAVNAAEAPPPLPAEDQPPLAEEGYLWTPGYWYWRDQRYFWISGAWVRPPQVGLMWTPPYWVAAGNVFVFHPGHWGSTVGYYGGVDYGHGYFGSGYTGGHWVGNSFAYNSAITHLNPSVAHHTYAESVPNQGSRGVVNFAGAPRAAAALHTDSQNQSPPRALGKPATTAELTRAPTPNPIELNRPTSGSKTPAPSAAAKPNRVTPPRAAPVKQ